MLAASGASLALGVFIFLGYSANSRFELPNPTSRTGG
jgi:hypothetical protein